MSAVQMHSQSATLHLLTHCSKRIIKIAFHVENKVTSPRIQELINLCKEKKVPYELGARSKELLTTTVASFQYTDFKEFLKETESKERVFVLALDHLQDPQNFGALCRTAEAMGLDGVVIAKDRSVEVTSGVYHASVGAVETIPIMQVANIGDALRKLKDKEFWVLGAALNEESKPLSETPDYEKKVLVLGKELEGLPSQILKICDFLIQIPMQGKVQSLNVSSSGAIIMYTLNQ